MNTKRHVISGAFVFLLLGVFAVLCTIQVLVGAQAYRGTVDRTTLHNEQRIVESFIRNAVRAQDDEDSVHITDDDVVCLVSTEDGERYCRYIYLHDGTLREFYTSEGNPFEPENGEELCSLNAFSATLQGGILTLRLTDTSSAVHEVSVAVVCAQ